MTALFHDLVYELVVWCLPVNNFKSNWNGTKTIKQYKSRYLI